MILRLAETQWTESKNCSFCPSCSVTSMMFFVQNADQTWTRLENGNCKACNRQWRAYLQQQLIFVKQFLGV